tara:strand:- start:16 stop:762 length:747 start_codon:yes stop_codon:yes gene_type:complete
MKTIKLDERMIYKDSLYKYLDFEVSKYTSTVYITSDSLKCASFINLPDGKAVELDHITAGIKDSPTGVIVFVKGNTIDILIPAFPVLSDAIYKSYNDKDLKILFNKPRLIGIIMLRLGRFALGVLENEQIIATKTEGRYVKNRHKAGGSSQRRFERSRERLVREFYDKSCQETNKLFEKYFDKFDCIFLGGEKHTLNGFKKRCPIIIKHEHKIMNRLLDVNIPNQKSLNIISRQVYSSKLVTYELFDE